VSNNSKQILRERILKLLRNQREDERLTKSLMIKDKLFQMWEFQKAKTIFQMELVKAVICTETLIFFLFCLCQKEVS